MTATLWLLGDQLAPRHLAQMPDSALDDLRILMIESAARACRLDYHPKKLVLLFSAMRHRAEALRKEGYQVDYRQAGDMVGALRAHCEAHHPDRLLTVEASSYRGQQFQQGLGDEIGIPVQILPNHQFLSNRFDPLPDVKSGENVRQETFYRAMRRYFNLMMDDDGKPLGGKWNFDKQNRQTLPEDLDPPDPVTFEPDELTLKVIEDVAENYQGVGDVSDFRLPVTPEDAQRAADDFFSNRFAKFGTYEDAMSRGHDVVFHSKLSPCINLGLLDPLDLAQRAEVAYREDRVTINNAEGFIRQVIGWREYMFWQYRRLMPDLAEGNTFDTHRPVPEFFWTGETEMNCLKHVLGRVLRDGYAHHIERLMILSNFCTLAGFEPQEVLDWFQSTFIDAYDWVMVPNVIGMGLYADGGQIGTKPYIASANYINKMSDYCKGCCYKHNERTEEDACPFNFLYWGFLLQHEDRLRENSRMARMLYNLKYLDEDERERVRDAVDTFLGGM